MILVPVNLHTDNLNGLIHLYVLLDFLEEDKLNQVPILKCSLLLVTNVVVENFLAVALDFIPLVEINASMSNQTENLRVDLKHLADSNFV